ncbi:MAG: Ig-like domain-containing protein [Deltaproteobacteria bacterium]|nr:Ig-like domain-containing protein [Deltaproteobacteria bacterium]
MSGRTDWSRLFGAVLGASTAVLVAASPARAAVMAPISGEIQLITVDNLADHWSGGKIVVGGQVVILPRNLLLDLPANRLTLTELFTQAPVSCQLAGLTGLAKGDVCNTTGAGGFATIHANRTDNGNVIAGDVFIEKGVESVIGQVTHINYADGYFVLNGLPNDSVTGVMVRLNDPDARHTVQTGLGCALGNTVNCSPDPRFTLDGDNYTNVFTTGYPLCIPSTVARTFTDVLGLGTTTAQAAVDGTGDALCPESNRTSLPAADSRRFAPIQLGDSVVAEGNFEFVAGVRFLSAHSTQVQTGITTRDAPDQPDYLFLEEFEVDAAGFQNQRLRTLMIGFSTLPPDVLIWTLHYDPQTNQPHELPMASVRGCDLAGGAGTCGNQGLVGLGANIWKIRHDVDFLFGAAPKLNPCAHLQNEPRFGTGFCPNGGGLGAPGVSAEQFAIMSPIPHEVQARTGHSLAFPGLVTLDVMGNQATNGQYLFPFGVGLGGVSFPEMVEINLAALATPFSFTGLPWTLDRRLSPAGCIDVTGDGVVDCEAGPQPLDPYPFEGTFQGVLMDPRTLASVPQGPYSDPNFTALPLTRAADRILSFVDAAGQFQGDLSVLAWPPVNPPALPIPATPVAVACAVGAGGGVNSAVVANNDSASANPAVPTNINVAANDTGTLSLTTLLITSGPSSGTVEIDPLLDGSVIYTSSAGFSGADVFTYTIEDLVGVTSNTATVTVIVNPPASVPPTALGDTATTVEGTPVDIAVLTNDTAVTPATLDPASVTITLAAVDGLAVADPATGVVRYLPAIGFAGLDSFAYVVRDSTGAVSNAARVDVNVTGLNQAPLTVNDTAGPLPAGVAVAIPVLTNDTDADGPGIDVASVQIGVPPTIGTAILNADGTITYTGNVAGTDTFTYTVADALGARSLAGTVTVAIAAPTDVLTVSRALYRTGTREWRVEGTTDQIATPGNTITLHVGATVAGPVLGTATANAAGAWVYRTVGAALAPDQTSTISIESTGGGVLLAQPITVTR